jgi:hypothetical protein
MRRLSRPSSRFLCRFRGLKNHRLPHFCSFGVFFIEDQSARAEQPIGSLYRRRQSSAPKTRLDVRFGLLADILTSPLTPKTDVGWRIRVSIWVSVYECTRLVRDACDASTYYRRYARAHNGDNLNARHMRHSRAESCHIDVPSDRRSMDGSTWEQCAE